MMKVPLLDLQAQHRGLLEELERALGEVLASGRFVLGERVAALERALAAFTGARHAVGLSSGSDALLACLMALDVGPGDEVVTTPYTFFATAGAVARLGARPVFADILPETFNLDPRAAAARLGPRTKAVIPVHLYGLCAELAPLAAAAAARGVPLVEDACQALGAAAEGRRAGALGRAACFSFYPTKNLGGLGDGGLCTTSDDGLAARLRRLRDHGASRRYHHDEVGGNFRLDELQAAGLLVKLQYLEGWNEARRERARRYAALFAAAGLEEVRPPAEPPPGYVHVWHQYVVRAQDRDGLRDWLRAREVGCEVYYPVPLHRQRCFAHLGYREGEFPESERAARETLALPMYPELAEGQQEHVVATIRAFYRR